MTIQEIKCYLKEKKITYQELSDMSGIALNTLKNIFRGKTENPRIDTMQAIERALGLGETPELTEDQKQLYDFIAGLSPEETQELLKFVDYIISKRG